MRAGTTLQDRLTLGDFIVSNIIIYGTFEGTNCPFVPLPPEGWVVAGGAARRLVHDEKLNDVDYFYVGGGEGNTIDIYRHLTHFNHVVTNHCTRRNCEELEVVCQVSEHELKAYKVQIITKYEPKGITSLFDRMDFTIGQFALDHSGRLFTTMDAISDLRVRVLRCNNINTFNVFDALRRSYKYNSKGFRPPISTIAELARILSLLDEEEIGLEGWES